MFNPDLAGTVKVLDRRESHGVIFEIIQYTQLYGHYGVETVQYVNKLHQVRVALHGGELITEAGALQFMKGNVQMKTDSSLAGMAKGFLSNALTKESSVKPHYTGQGEVYLEPSYHHYLAIELQGSELIADRGIFYCCEGGVTVGVQSQKNISAAMVGGEGLFQTKLSGNGVVILQTSVPAEQILKYELKNETLQVDGNYAIARMGNIDFTVEKSTKSLLGSARSGEGLLHTYRGTGQVWLIPAMRFVNTFAETTPVTA